MSAVESLRLGAEGTQGQRGDLGGSQVETQISISVQTLVIIILLSMVIGMILSFSLLEAGACSLGFAWLRRLAARCEERRLRCASRVMSTRGSAGLQRPALPPRLRRPRAARHCACPGTAQPDLGRVCSDRRHG